MSYQGVMTDSSQPTTLPLQTVPVHNARAMVGDENTAMVVLDDKTYTLRITRAGKLILTK